MEQPNFDGVAQLIEVMKPCAPDEDKLAHRAKIKTILTSPDYVAEDKIDGCHYFTVAYKFYSSAHVDKTNNFPHLVKVLQGLNMPNLILDGEVNYPGKTSQFCTRITGGLPATAIKGQQEFGPIHYTIWDILRTPKGTWLGSEPLYKRRSILEHWYNSFIKGTPAEEFIHLTQWCLENKEAFIKAQIDAGLEGAVLKHLKGVYTMGKRPMWNWIKIKTKDTADFFIMGYEDPTVIYTGKDFESWPYWKEINGDMQPVTELFYHGWIGALKLGAYVNGVATEICTCSGITKALRQDITENKEKYLNRVVKTVFMEKTEAGYPRHPRFDSFHESKQAHECIWIFR